MFNGTLNSNEIFSALYNMIISQEVFAANVYSTASELVDMSRVDGGLYGDTKLFYSTDVLKSHPWGNDAEAANLLALDRPAAPACQAIELDVFRQIRLTVDNYLSKRAWSTEGAFSSFNSVMLGWIRETKRIYDATTFNAYIGTASSAIGKQAVTIALPAEPTAGAGEADQEAYNRARALTVATELANLLVDLKDISRDYNDNGYLRSYNPDDLVIVWNSEVVNEIEKLDMPTIFHKDGMFANAFKYVLPARYFGVVNTNGGTTIAQNATIRALVEKDYVVSGTTYHVFAGEVLPGNATYLANETYTVDGDIAFKVFHKRSVPYMSAFEVGTSFFNPRSLTENHYLTFGHNTLEYLKEFPMITATLEVAQ